LDVMRAAFSLVLVASSALASCTFIPVVTDEVDVAALALPTDARVVVAVRHSTDVVALADAARALCEGPRSTTQRIGGVSLRSHDFGRLTFEQAADIATVRARSIGANVLIVESASSGYKTHRLMDVDYGAYRVQCGTT
jgi:hypothetical protein